MSEIDDEKCKNESGKNGEGGSAASESFFNRCYEICVGGQLDSSWADWFEGLEMRPWGEACTILCGNVADQAALLGILNKICRLNLPLVSVNQVDPEERLRRSKSEGGE